MTDNSRLDWGVHNGDEDKWIRKWYLGGKTGSSWGLMNFGSVLNVLKLSSSRHPNRDIE